MEPIGDFELGRALGEGATGRVYEALERSTGRHVALKIMHAELVRTEAVRRTVVQELSALTRLRSRHAAACLSCREIDGKVVLAFELLQGETLRARIERGRLPWHEAVTIAMEIGDALADAHELQPPMLHRDLKPESILLTADGTKVTDFGIAKVLGAAGQTTTAAFGNIKYMSPEQIDAWGIDARSDLYCLGLVLYEMVVGRQPFVGNSPRELINAQCTKPPPPFPPELAATVPPDLERVVRHLLEKSMEARPASAREAVKLLHAVLHGLPVGLAATAASATSRPAVAAPAVARPVAPAASKPPVALIAIGLVGGIVALGGGGYVLLRSDPPPAATETTATPQAKTASATTPKPTPTPTKIPTSPSLVSPLPIPVEATPVVPPQPVGETPIALPSAAELVAGLGETGEDADTGGTEDELESAAVATPTQEQAAVDMLVGSHKCGIHWLSKRGTCNFTKDGETLKVSGSQSSSGDFFKINGRVRVLSDRTFMVDGTIDSNVGSCCGKVKLSGSFKFKRVSGRKYWRLQDPMRSKICHPTQICMYYIDIFMK